MDQSGNTLFQTAGFEKKLTADQNHSEVVPPFNAYAPAGVVEVSCLGDNKHYLSKQRFGFSIASKAPVIFYSQTFLERSIKYRTFYNLTLVSVNSHVIKAKMTSLIFAHHQRSGVTRLE